ALEIRRILRYETGNPRKPPPSLRVRRARRLVLSVALLPGNQYGRGLWLDTSAAGSEPCRAIGQRGGIAGLPLVRHT
ncbi:hypothetical protein AVEN_73529-1, partial [Araneus ventricosus]